MVAGPSGKTDCRDRPPRHGSGMNNNIGTQLRLAPVLLIAAAATALLGACDAQPAVTHQPVTQLSTAAPTAPAAAPSVTLKPVVARKVVARIAKAKAVKPKVVKHATAVAAAHAPVQPASQVQQPVYAAAAQPAPAASAPAPYVPVARPYTPPQTHAAPRPAPPAPAAPAYTPPARSGGSTTVTSYQVTSCRNLGNYNYYVAVSFRTSDGVGHGWSGSIHSPMVGTVYEGGSAYEIDAPVPCS